MHFSKGQFVVAKDFKGRQLRCRVWSSTEAAVFVASEEIYRELEAGTSDLQPVGFPTADVTPAAPAR
jgi:hypothetical protein